MPIKSSQPGATGLSSINHIVFLMLENRSFDHMLGWLYSPSNQSPLGNPYEGLTGKESNPGASGPVLVQKTTTTTTPTENPGEGYHNTNAQLFGGSGGSTTAPAAGTTPTMTGFIKNYTDALNYFRLQGQPDSIMDCYDPSATWALSFLARNYAVCDHWYSSAPTETLPNRAFSVAATSAGRLADTYHPAKGPFPMPTIFNNISLHQKSVTWAYYNDLTNFASSNLFRLGMQQVQGAEFDANFKTYEQFQSDAQAGNLPNVAYIDPTWSSKGNDDHPNQDIGAAEQFMWSVYRTLFASPQWPQTLLVITYDEHGGCYDHVPPPWGAVPPGDSSQYPGDYGFDFTRFGVRVPAVAVSPWIAAGTVFRGPTGGAPFDHTSILATIERRFNVPPLTARDKAAPDLGPVISLKQPRTDDPAKGFTPPAFTPPVQSGDEAPTHLQQVAVQLASALPKSRTAGRTHHVSATPVPSIQTHRDAENFVRERAHQFFGPASEGSRK